MQTASLELARIARNELALAPKTNWSAGPIGSKLNTYFNKSCFTTPPIIGADGIGTRFGYSRTRIVDGPGQANLNFALTKEMFVLWPPGKKQRGIPCGVLQRFQPSAVCES